MHLLISTPGASIPTTTYLSHLHWASQRSPGITFLALWAVKDQHPHNNSSSILRLVQDSSNPPSIPRVTPGCPQHLAIFIRFSSSLLWRQDKTDIVILEEEKMNSGAQCPGFKSQLRQLPLQAWWLSLRATATHAGPPERGGQTRSRHTVCPGPSCAPARTQRL